MTRRCFTNLAEAAGLADELSQKGRGGATGREWLRRKAGTAPQQEREGLGLTILVM